MRAIAQMTDDCGRQSWRFPARERLRRGTSALSVLVTALLLVVCPIRALAQVQVTYLYSLSNFGGQLPYDWARVYVDQERNETYVIFQNLVRIFNASGMETFSFGDDLDLGQLVDVAVDGHGDIILLSYKDTRPLVTRCDFRGVPIAPIEITDLPDSLVFGANRMILQNGLYYFASLNTASVIVTDSTGKFREHINLFATMELAEKEKTTAEVSGFSVDKDGNLFFTIPVFFRAFKLAPDKTLTTFGRPGSAPGRFGIAAGIVADSRGNVIVADRLRSVIMVFDKDFRFLTEFGTRGLRPENLIIPDDVAIDSRDRVYVTQARRRGVSVFALAGS